MKKLEKIVVLVIILLVTFSLSAKTKVKFFLGDATCQLAGEEQWTKLAINQELSTGDSIKTGPKAYVELDVDGNYIKLQESSQMKLSQSLDGEEKSDSVDMNRGNLKLKLNKLKKENKGFQVNTPSSVCAVRGTEFTVAAGYDGTTLLQVEEGQVEFMGETKSVMVARNQQSEVRLGREPSEVTDVKPQEWNKWLSETKVNMSGNEAAILEDALKKIQKLDAEITELENSRAELEKSKETVDAEAKKLKAAGDNDGFKSKAAETFSLMRKSHLALMKIYYRAENINLVKSFAESVYAELDKEKIDQKTQDVYSQIIETYNKYYKKYIEEVVKEQKRMRDRKAQKK